MKIAIVGFPGCGKSTCFKAISEKTKNEIERLDPAKPRIAAVKVFDQRLEKLKTFFNPKKLTYAEIIFEDLPGFHTPRIKEAEAFMEVLGIFSDSRDPVKDMENMDAEFILGDLSVIEHRIPALDKELKQEKSRERVLERETLLKCKSFLEKNAALRNLEFTSDEEKAIRGFRFLSRKPLFILGNISENQTESAPAKKMEAYSKEKGIKTIEFCAKLEAEIVDLEESERDAFLKELGIKEILRERLVRLAYDSLGYITFFTAKGSETKAWPVKSGTTAIEAAGKIHSDMQKGFIKAEVVNFNDLTSSGSMQEVRKKALLKLEGKEYKIKDGDIVDFRFSK